MTPMSKTKICLVSYRDPYEVVLDNFSKAILSKNNYEVTLLGSGANNSEPCTDNYNRKIVKLRLAETTYQSWRKFTFALKVIKYLNSNSFSIIHLDISCRYFGLIKLLTRRNRIFIFHILSYPVTDSRFIRFKMMLLVYLQCLLMNKIIVQSQEIKDRWLGIKNLNKAIVIPVGFDKDKFFRLKSGTRASLQRKLNIPRNCPLIVYSGVISLNRKLEVLIYSMPIISEFNQHTKLLFIGAGKAEGKLRALAKSIDMDNSLIFTGFVPHEEVVNYLGVADIAISYVPINESYNYNPPLKTYEYLACGLPTIATRTISNQKIIKDGVNGILVKDTPECIAAAVIKLLSNSELRDYLSQNARSSITKFDYKYLTSEFLIPMYEKLLTKS